MRELFATNPQQPPAISSNHYLRFDGVRAQIQVVAHDEIDRLGIEQAISSRGARIIQFDHELFYSDTPELAISNSADVIVIVEPSSSFSSGPDLLNSISAVRSVAPESRILVITSLSTEQDVLDMLTDKDSAASDHILRSGAIDTDGMLVRIRQLALGEPGRLVPLSEYTRNKLVARSASIPNLTEREAEILALVARGISNKKIAEILGLSLRTVNNHVGMIFLKLGINSNPEINARVTAALTYCVSSRAITSDPLPSNQSNASGQSDSTKSNPTHRL
jgi:DNA-binding NarL/FixJ family response regulator